MINLINFSKKVLILGFLPFLIFFSSFVSLSADDITWVEVARTVNEIQFIDVSSIKYNSNSLLTVVTEYKEINPEDQEVLNSNSYLIAIDCENRLFSKLAVNTDIRQVKDWEKPINNKLIKKTILNSCSF